jgi:hypothetical protein
MRKQVKRKVWSTGINTIYHAITGACITEREKLDKLRVMEYSALEAITKGMGTIQDWHTITEVLNLSETMARGGIGPEVLPVCEKAQKALFKAAERYNSTMQLGLTGEGIQAVRELIEFADLQQSSISRSEFERYIQKTRDYLKSKNNNVVEII